MSNKKISQLNSALTANDSDLIPLVQSGETKKITKLNFLSGFGGGAAPQTFNYELSYLVTEADIGKLMMQVWEVEGDLDRAAVYQEAIGAFPDYYYVFDYVISSGEYMEFYIQTSSSYNPVQVQEGVDFTGNADLDIQFASVLAGMQANAALTALYDVVAYPAGGTRAIRFTGKRTGWGWSNGNISVSAYGIQDGFPGGPINLALGKLIEITGDGWGVIAPYNGQTFIAVGSIAKNAQIVGTDNGKVRARGESNWYQDCVVGLAKTAVNDGEEVTLNYCPRTPEIWNGYFEERLPTTPQEAIDMFAFYYWD